MTWRTVQINSSGQHSIGPMNSDIYGGLSGIGLFYLKLYKITKDSNYYSEYRNCIDTAKRISEYYNEYESAYTGALSPIYPLLLEDYIMGTNSNYCFIKKTFTRLDKQGFSKNAKIDWIDGLSSILKLSIECLNITGDSDYIPIIHRIFSKLLALIKNRNKDEIFIGFAHGYSGVSLAMSYYYKLFPADDIKDSIIELLEKEITSTDLNKCSYWCAGSMGMLQARVLIKDIIDSNVIAEQIETIKDKINIKNAFTTLDDSLCHGLAGFIYNYDIISNLKIENSFDKIDSIISFIAVNRLINQEYNIERVPSISTKGIFTGYAGIGISLIKILSNDTDNLLTLSIY
ncbi:hypothetical protein IGJ34_002409 [Enterococcus sp. AZ177]